MLTKRYYFPIFCGFWLLLATVIVRAQRPTDGNGWRVWLRDVAGNVILVDNQGQIQTEATPPEIAAPNGDFLPAPPVDTFPPTGEILFIAPDDRFPALPGFPNNTLYVYDPTLSAYYPFYTSDDLALTDAHFVQNGRLILLEGLTPQQMTVWWLIQRNGRYWLPLLPGERRSIHGTADGFVYLRAQSDGNTTLVEVNLNAPFLDRVMWTDAGSWEIVQVENQVYTYGPFLLWAQLTEPVRVNPPEIVVAPTPYPTPLPLLSPGDAAIVQTIDGEVLYLRETPLTGEIIMHLLNGMRVELLEGPVQAGDFIWWRVRTADGTEGWAAQACEDVTTLLPDRENIP